MKYDVIIVGAGLYGCTFARICKDNGLTPVILEKTNYIAGNCHDKKIIDINVHLYGAHIFRTSDKKVYDFISRFTRLIPYSHQVLAKYNNKYYNLPINKFTLQQLYGIEYYDKYNEDVDKYSDIKVKNLEDKVRHLAGDKVYKKLFKYYSEKQWNKPCTLIPEDTIRRIQFRDNYNNDYFSETYEGIPDEGYSKMCEEMAKDIEILYGVKATKEYLENYDIPVFYNGQIDEYFGYKYGRLEYRSLKFSIQYLDRYLYQPTAVVNSTDRWHKYTRIIEHKHFDQRRQCLPYTIITKEYPSEFTYDDTSIPFYTVNDKKNMELYNKYKKLKHKNVTFVGRLGTYQYLDMNETIKLAIKDANNFIRRRNENKS